MVGEQVTREMLEGLPFRQSGLCRRSIGKIAERTRRTKEATGTRPRPNGTRSGQSPDKELRRQKLFAKTQAYGAYHFDEDRAKYEMKAILAFIRIWAQNKTENRKGWLQALNRVVCGGERSQRLDSLSRFSAGTDREAGGTHRRQVCPGALPKLYEGFVRTDPHGRTFPG